jgi:hypothetical protein
MSFPLLAVMMGFSLLQVVAVMSLGLRFLRSTGMERQQMKWMALGVGFLAATWPAEMLGAPRWLQAIPTAILVAAIVIAVTRYRLSTSTRSSAARSPTDCSARSWLVSTP